MWTELPRLPVRHNRRQDEIMQLVLKILYFKFSGDPFKKDSSCDGIKL